MRKFLEDHGLGMLVVFFMVSSFISSIALGSEAKDVVVGIFHDSFGASILVFGSKRLREAGSSESK